MRIADRVWERIGQEVDTVFYIPGGGAAGLVDALGLSGLNAVCCLHEQGAGYAAVGYAQHHGFGVCLTTSGPGATNAITPCLSAWVDSVPVMFVSGQVMLKWLSNGQRSRGTQESPTIEIVKPITKLAEMVRGEKSAKHWVDFGIWTAKNKRPGPVWLDFPMDVQAVEL